MNIGCLRVIVATGDLAARIYGQYVLWKSASFDAVAYGFWADDGDMIGYTRKTERSKGIASTTISCVCLPLTLFDF